MATVTSGVVDVDAADQLARVFKVLADPTRIRLVSLIAAAVVPDALRAASAALGP